MMVLVVATLASFAMVYYVMLTKEGKFEKPIGEREFEIISAATRADKALVYIDLSAKYSASQALYELSKKGGFELDNPNTENKAVCGEYLGFALMNNRSKFCFPDYENNFFTEFEKELNNYMVAYPDIYMPINNYDYFIDKNILYGKAKEKISTGKEVSSSGIDKITQTIITSKQSSMIVGDFAWPSSYPERVVTSCFGKRKVSVGSKFHNGIDLRAKMGDPVFAIADGTVTKVKQYDWGELKIMHANGLESRYLHNSKILVKEGQKVVKGQIVARAGNTAPKGTYVPVHIHFEARMNGDLVDPIENVFSIEKFDIKFSNSANCVYNKNNYAYKDKIENRVTT